MLTLESLQRQMQHNVTRARNGFLVLLAFVLIASGFIYQSEQQACRESHRRYSTLHAVIITSTTVTPVAKQRVTGAQLALLESYDHDLRVRLLSDLGAAPTC